MATRGALRRGLDAASREHVADFYARALRRFGPSHSMAVWWASPATQQRRFEVLSEVGPWQGVSVADIGCGLGDLFGFLEARGLGVRYRGFDITPAMVEAARVKHAHPRARFEVREVVARGLPGRFDYVVASGTFNIRVRRQEGYLHAALRTMYGACRRAVAFNVLEPIPSDHPDAELMEQLYGELFSHVDVERLLVFCRGVARRVELRSGYLPWDVTVFMYRAH